ncbi:MAG: hypothetical protein RLZ17_628 [Actinomycetota bacterium]
MSVRLSRAGLVSGLASIVMLLAGPVAPALAVASTVTVVNQTSISVGNSTLRPGTTISIGVCFEGTMGRVGGADGDVKLFLNTRSAGIAWAGVRSDHAGVTNGCLVFPYTVLDTDTSQVLLKPTSLTLANSATLTVTGKDTITVASTALSGELCGSAPCTVTNSTTNFLSVNGSAASVDTTAPLRTAVSPADGAAAVLATADLVLTTDEATTSNIPVRSRSCASFNGASGSAQAATVLLASSHDIVIGDEVFPLNIGAGYNTGTGGLTYFKVIQVNGQAITYTAACTNENSTTSTGSIAPLRYVTIGADADATAKTCANKVATAFIMTLTCANHGFAVGEVVVMDSATPEYNGVYLITAVSDANNFSYDFRRAAASSTTNVSMSPNVVGSSGNIGSAGVSNQTARRVIEAIPTHDATRVAFSNSAPFTVTVNPNAMLPGSTPVHVRVGNDRTGTMSNITAIRDANGNGVAQIANATTWNFATAAGPASITDITSSTTNGSYRNGGGTAPSIQVRFNQSVTVAGGNPELLLNAGAGAVAIYASGSGTNTLTFTYTIGAGHSTLVQAGQKLNVTGINLPTGVTISGVTAATPVPASMAIGSLNANKSIMIDNTAPTPSGFMPFPGAVGTQATQALSVTFGENMTAVTTKRMFINTVTPHVAKTITNAALTTNVATITTQTAHGLVAGNTVTIAAMTGANAAVFNGTHLVVAAPTTTTFTFAKTNGNVTSAAADGTVTRTIWETITLGTNANVAVTQFANNSGAMVTITRTGKASTVNLVTAPATQYYVTYEAGAFADLAGNTTAALSSTTAWFFEASPDTVAPVFNASQSDPPHNMANFTLDRNIELAFSEAVSTVACQG